MSITDEMVERARASLYGCNGNPLTRQNIRSALTAALSDQERAVEVKVKPLEWGGDGDCYAFADVTHQSYSIVFEEGKFWSNWDMSLPPFGTIEAAKTAAQADYEQRIRSALVDVPVEPGIPTANCCVCRRIIDTREKSEGGDDFGDETEPGKWTCSVQCYDAYVGFVPDEPAPHREGEDSAEVEDERLAFEGWAIGNGLFLDERFFEDGNNYIDHVTRLAYDVWMARSALAATRSASATSAKGCADE
ncbi:hypothetical protein B5M44_04420 [Shinella sumterensis]|uniref:hypothetical protein n=1 Tax=Shinella sumterensis TaxID=1967501 RepID=UPI001101B2B2|nr:hypothetical protein [Shinella sumterensis]TFE99448.1 hypothetical protein B5M44_04420 [Shinella sumterensis]